MTNEQTNMLKILMEKQKELDEKIGGDNTYTEMEMLNLMATSMMVECGEYMNEIKGFKFWSKNIPTEINEKMEKELIDILHFLLSSLNRVFVTPEKVVEAYMKKNKINHDRQKNNY